MMTTTSDRKRWPRDTTPISVKIREGTVVFHDGEQRGGTLHDVPKYRADLGILRAVMLTARVCPNCSKPVGGRRKWCSQACRVQAYRDRRQEN